MSEEQTRTDEPTVEELLSKSRESVFTAVSIYNNPFSMFRTESYIIHMVIAWNSLLQAIFLKRKEEIYEKDGVGRFIFVDQRKKTIATEKLVRRYFQNQSDPIFLNLDFIIKLRNEIEHAVYAEIDKTGIDLFGECQALLLNYESALTNEFGEDRGLPSHFGLAIQFSKKLVTEQIETQIEPLKSYNLTLKEFIEAYREQISIDVYNDDRFRFSIYMVPKLSNNKHKNDVPVIFNKNLKINTDDVKLEDSGFLAVKYTSVKVPSQDLYNLKPSNVVELINKGIGRSDFTIHLHTKCWVRYKAHPRTKATSFKNDYCIFDTAHRDYIYSMKWVDFLTQKLGNNAEYDNIKYWKLKY